MLCFIPHSINLENSILRNSIGLLTIITLLNKTSIITLPDIIINSINTFITNTNTTAEKFLDGNITQNTCDNTCNNIPNVLLNNTNTNSQNSLEKIIIKSILNKFILEL